MSDLFLLPLTSIPKKGFMALDLLNALKWEIFLRKDLREGRNSIILDIKFSLFFFFFSLFPVYKCCVWFPGLKWGKKYMFLVFGMISFSAHTRARAHTLPPFI